MLALAYPARFPAHLVQPPGVRRRGGFVKLVHDLAQLVRARWAYKVRKRGLSAGVGARLVLEQDREVRAERLYEIGARLEARAQLAVEGPERDELLKLARKVRVVAEKTRRCSTLFRARWGKPCGHALPAQPLNDCGRPYLCWQSARSDANHEVRQVEWKLDKILENPRAAAAFAPGRWKNDPFAIARTLAEPPKYFVLTWPNEPTLKGINDKINRWLDRLRHTRLWREKVLAAVVALEAPLGRDGKTFNVHLNVLYWGDYIPVAANFARKGEQTLSGTWRRVTRIPTAGVKFAKKRPQRGRHGVLREVIKYAAKVEDFDSLLYMEEAFLYLSGRRRIRTYGLIRRAAALDPAGWTLCPECDTWRQELEVEAPVLSEAETETYEVERVASRGKLPRPPPVVESTVTPASLPDMPEPVLL